MFKSCCKVFMRLDRGKIILNKTAKVTFSSKKDPGKWHLHNGKTYPRCNSSPDIMGITGKFEPFFQSRFSKSKVRCRYSSTRDRMTSEYPHEPRCASSEGIGPRWTQIFTVWCMVHVANRSSDGSVENSVSKCIQRYLWLFTGFDNNNV